MSDLVENKDLIDARSGLLGRILTWPLEQLMEG